MYKTCEIRLPNSRWKKYTISTNTTIEDLLKKICNENNLDASNLQLEYRKNVLRSNVTIGSLNLPNNAKIECIDKSVKDGEENKLINIVISVTSFLPNVLPKLELSVPATANLWALFKTLPSKHEIYSSLVDQIQQKPNDHSVKFILPNGRTYTNKISLEKLCLSDIIPLSANNVDKPLEISIVINKVENESKLIESETLAVKKIKISDNVCSDSTLFKDLPPPIYFILSQDHLNIFRKNLAATDDKLYDSLDFFKPTESEIKFMMSDLSKRRKELENAVFKTKAMLELERVAKFEANPYTLIRFVLTEHSKVINLKDPEKLIIQTAFRTSTPISDLYKFIRDVFPAHAQYIILYTTPPKTILPNTQNKNLFDFNLYRTAIIHLSSNNNSTSVTLVDKNILKIKQVNFSQAESAVQNFIITFYNK